MLNIQVVLDNLIVLQCNYLQLVPFAPNSGRKLVFSGIQLLKQGKIATDSRLKVSLTIDTPLEANRFLNEFELIVIDCSDESDINGDWWVYGELVNVGYPEYSQGEVDVFNMWGKNEVMDWFGTLDNADRKVEYIDACLKYSGLSTKIAIKDKYILDFTKAKDELDLCYLASVGLIGERAYLGRDFHTFRDCIIELYHYHGFFDDVYIEVIGCDNQNDGVFISVIKKYMQVLIDYKFSCTLPHLYNKNIWGW